MPQVIIEHDISLSDKTKVRLVETLRKLCARLFSTEAWPLTLDDFGVKFNHLKPPSRSTNNVVVRITLHPFEDRIERSETHAVLIRNAVLLALEADKQLLEKAVGASLLIRPTVGVSLTYAHIAWCSGTFEDVP